MLLFINSERGDEPSKPNPTASHSLAMPVSPMKQNISWMACILSTSPPPPKKKTLIAKSMLPPASTLGLQTTSAHHPNLCHSCISSSRGDLVLTHSPCHHSPLCHPSDMSYSDTLTHRARCERLAMWLDQMWLSLNKQTKVLTLFQCWHFDSQI